MDIQISGKLHQLSTRGLSDNYKNDIQVFNKWLSGRPVNAASIAEFFSDRAGSCKPSTIRRNKAAIKKALRLSLGNGVTLDQLAQFRAFFDEIKPGKVNLSVTGDKILNKQELNKLVKASGPKTGLIVRALYETAARVSELLNIELENCKPGRQGITIELYRQKTRTTDIVYMRKELFNEIRATYKGDKYLFENKNGKPLSRFTVNTLLKHAGAKIGRPDIHAHTLRHSWGSAALPVLGLAKVSKYLGHSRVDTTSRFYLHGKPSEEEISAVNVLQFAV